MKIRYGISKPNPEKKHPKWLRENHTMEVEVDPKDASWGAKVRMMIGAKHPGWSVSGFAELKERTIDPNRVALLTAFELGYRCAEKGMNLQMAIEEFCAATE